MLENKFRFLLESTCRLHSVTAKNKTLYIGKKNSSLTKMEIELPATLELVSSIAKKTSQTAIGGVTVSYKTSNAKVATVDKKGKITAKGIGKVNILTTITLYSGKTKVTKTSITIKKPVIKLK